MIVKIHAVRGQKIVTIIDSNLLNKKFEENNLQLDLTADFYKGEEKSEDEIKVLVQNAYIIHLVGEESMSLAISQKWIDKENMIKIDGIPHAEVVVINDS